MESFSNQDIATEVLSRLPAESLSAFKCTSKRWYRFISDPSFLRLLVQKWNTISGLFVQEGSSDFKRDFKLLNYISLDTESCRVQDMVLDFLPEKVVLLASSGGLVCCRSVIYKAVQKYGKIHEEKNLNWNMKIRRKRLVIYICNPATRKWIALRPGESHVCEAFGLAFYPSGLSSPTGPSFKLVGIRKSENDPNSYSLGIRKSENGPNSYSFVIYSSERETWKTTQEAFNFNYEIYMNKETFVNGRFHWVTENHHIITFDAEQELSQVIKLPGVTMNFFRCPLGLCLGESEGYLHYVGVFQYELKVWMLKEYNEPEWVVKFCLPMIEFSDEHPDIYGPYNRESYYSYPHPEYVANYLLKPLSFHNEVLYFRSGHYIFSYNFKSGIFMKHCPIDKSPEYQLGYYFRDHPTVIPYSASLASLWNFKSVCLRPIRHTGRNFCRRTRRRKPKMLKM